jgi:hypothetical protein
MLMFPGEYVSEYEIARQELEGLKNEIHQYLVASYPEGDPAAQCTYEWMESVVEDITKRKSFSISFNPAGPPDWTADLLQFISTWITYELRASEALSNQLDWGESYDDGCSSQ